MKSGSLLGIGLATAALYLATGCGQPSIAGTTGGETASPSTTPNQSLVQHEKDLQEASGHAIHASDLSLVEVPITSPVKVSGGRGSLKPPIAQPKVTAAQALTTFLNQGLPPDVRGKVVQARYGLYDDSSIGSMPDGKMFTPQFADTPVWILRVQAVTIPASGPTPSGGATAPSAAADHDILTIVDSESGTFLYTVQEGTNASF